MRRDAKTVSWNASGHWHGGCKIARHVANCPLKMKKNDLLAEPASIGIRLVVRHNWQNGDGAFVKFNRDIASFSKRLEILGR